MPPRTTSSGSSAPPLTGVAFLNEYAQRMKSLFDAAAFPLTSVGGTGNAVTASLDPPLDAGGLVNGMKFTITWGAANTGAVTLAINGGTAVPVVDADNVALPASALASGRRSLIEFVGGSFRILSSAGGGAAGGGPIYQAFTTSGTWTRPTGYDPDTRVIIELWGGGGGNCGGGGGYTRREMRIADLPSSVSVTIGAGGAGTSPGGTGGSTTFGSIATAFGGGGGSAGNGGGGGGEIAAGTTPITGGAIGGGAGTTGAGGDALSIFGGGGGGISGGGGNAVFGGGGGFTSGGRGVSVRAGNGGASGVAGTAPGGGGGGSAAGARGECRVWILG